MDEVCRYENWRSLAAHVRSNHIRTVMDADAASVGGVNAFKSYRAHSLGAAWEYTVLLVFREGRCGCAVCA